MGAHGTAQERDGAGVSPEARQGTGFVGANTFEYEDAYSLDQCFGDMVLETTIQVLGKL